ncbi:putative quinol monooxygenase [Novosphingobium sp. BL-8A]|uniref:putative quinol monooxygenase n=1 Tax=Novosphingobium sp. BL-8A TaxID=3127639 RepID=UPI003757BA21
MKLLLAPLTALSLAICIASATAREQGNLDLGPAMVRMAELEIEPAQLDAYKAILAAEQATSVRLEPGVLMLHSVSIADDPTKIRLLEVYANKSAYESHVRSPHFLKYKALTANMVRSLRLIDTDPILLCSKTMATRVPQAVCLSPTK